MARSAPGSAAAGETCHSGSSPMRWPPVSWPRRRSRRIGNYFNQELYGGPTTLPWGLDIYARAVSRHLDLRPAQRGRGGQHTDRRGAPDLPLRADLGSADRRSGGRGRPQVPPRATVALSRCMSLVTPPAGSGSSRCGRTRPPGFSVMCGSTWSSSAVVFVLALAYLLIMRKPRETADELPPVAEHIGARAQARSTADAAVGTQTVTFTTTKDKARTGAPDPQQSSLVSWIRAGRPDRSRTAGSVVSLPGAASRPGGGHT